MPDLKVIVHCSLCGKEIHTDSMEPRDLGNPKQVFDSIQCSMTDTGSLSWFDHGYGSDFDGESWLVAFCDECLAKMTPVVKTGYLFSDQRDKYWDLQDNMTFPEDFIRVWRNSKK